MFDSKKPKILITGGAGYIGTVLIQMFLKERFDITILDNFLFNQKKILKKIAKNKINIIEGDVRDKYLIKKTVSKFDTIIPLAAIVGAPLCKKNTKLTKSVNVSSINSLVKNLSKNQRIIVPTTNSGYGIGKKDKFCDENSPLNPISLYGQTKVAAEKIIMERENSISFRLATVFGVSKDRMRIDLMVNNFTYLAFKKEKFKRKFN